MEKPFNNIEDSLYSLGENAGIKQPSPNFLSNVMEAVSKQSVEQKEYQPLISKKVWYTLAAAIVIGIVLINIFPSDSTGFLAQYSFTDYLNFNFSLPEFKVSKTMIYAIGFLSLFLLQIPFIKYYHNKNYS
ncbi:MAG: hypothetical protein KUG68_08195 [Flavobacteriaceae bacterium]|nr:hypothetical protein [Flavobacteriaceae bacterium]